MDRLIAACLGICYTYTVGGEEVVEMTSIVLLLAALVFAFGVLIGSILQTQAVHREYRRIAERVRELHELQEVLADHNEVPVLARSGSKFSGTHFE
jgi:biopolymer transport protein ExbB/TolQ